MKIEWSELSQLQLRDIFDYYLFRANADVAHRILNKIVNKPNILLKQPNLGQTEELLKHHKIDFKYLVEGNYKIIYWLDRDTIRIASVFDCRQNPIKMSADIS